MNLIAVHPRAFLTDAEVLQELFHRFVAIRRWDEVREHFGSFVELFDGRVQPMFESDVTVAIGLREHLPHLSARDLVHVAVMLRVRSRQIITADRSFDAVPDIERLDPADVEEWRSIVTERP